MSTHEAATTLMASVPGRASTRARGASAIERLTEMARRDEVAARFVTAVLDAAAVELEAGPVLGALPQGEQATWRSVGAVFDDVDAVGRVRARTAKRFAELLSRSVQGDVALAKQLGVDPSRVSQRIKDRSIYAFTASDGRYFPQWQFVGKRKTVPHLKTVLSRLDESLHPLTVDHWFTTANLDLAVDEEPVSPVVWLETGGDPERVAALVEDL